MATITKMGIKNDTGPTDPILSEQLTVTNKYLRRIKNNVIFFFWFFIGWWLIIVPSIYLIFAASAKLFW